MELLQQDLDRIYKWADQNCLEFNENKVKMMSYGNRDATRPGKEIKPNKTLRGGST